ncbi:TonB-dependent receptor [Shewanella sp. SM20]|uniref:TonB-dependent receptor plug domain-containing protein n=1 Tax=Shewanella TaxID=22 RepID=UPI000DEB1B55|nr:MULTISPECIES: TonB-dependent receptor [unclassified Shewanella]RBP78792.1 outer membrane receptor protein involved in Fe transport [Shewanella putrefaciens]MCU7961612.1 TonB-dependent receptor [Shewanella sp. SW32]MCU7969694.1 TonB-dependent receptor [Shewanella sp. SW29]MCU8092913.1 TonB-dependent receptor [Shewanella sp. SM20]HAY94244.1 TonB-dependent receptor [Shewanella sp.]
MIKRTKVASAINLAIVASITTGAFVTSSAFAAEEKAKVERIEVTGSRIQRQDMETASPVTVIDAAAIKAEGFTSVDQMLQVQTSMAGAAVGSSTNNGADGVAQVDLRGMGSQRTLVLLNGRRMVNSGSGANSSVDLNSIPVAMIARVEILKDGASAVYGSDAIAGVVNIITKKDFEGFQLDFNGSGTDKGDGESGDVSALYGFNTDGGNYTFGAAFSDRRGVIQGDRDWYDPAENSSSIIPTGALNGKVVDANGNWVKQSTSYNFSPDVYFQTPNERRSLFANMTQELGNDVVLTADAIYTNRRSNQQLAAQPAQIKLNVCGAPGLKDPAANCLTLDDEMIAAGINPDKRGQVLYKRRMKDVGPRIYSQDTDTWRLSTGLAGSLDVHTGMNWNIDYTFGKNKAETAVENSINANIMAEAIYADPNAWFAGNPLTSEMKDPVGYTEAANGGNEQQTLSAGLNGELFDLSAGAVGFALGAEYRRESGFYNPDPIVVAGESTAAQQDPTDGNYNVISIFQEVSVPFTEKLTGEFALRLDDYSTFGKATTWKIGLTYAATDELMVRGVAATGFRAPSVAELYGGNSGSFDYLTNPWLSAAEQPGQILVNRTSDPDLKPEESESYTAGLVYSPSYLEGMSVTLDYWRFKVADAIARLDTQTGLDACKKGDASACKTFNITSDGDLTDLTNALTNVGSQDTSGIDFNLAYNFAALGLDWKINNDMTYLLNFEQDNEDYTGTIDGNFGAYSKIRNNFSISAGLDDWSIMYFNRYIASMDDTYTVYDDNDVPSGAVRTADSVLYHNISGTYHVNDMTTVSLGIKNFTDEKPSYVTNGSDAGTVPEVYDTIGRTIYGGVTVKF